MRNARNHIVIETGGPHLPFFGGTNAGFFSLSGIEPQRPTEARLSLSGSVRVPILLSPEIHHGIEMGTVFRRYMDENALGIFGRDHRAYQAGQEAMAGEGYLAGDQPCQFQLLSLQAQFDAHPSTAAGSNR
ncbi:hypothetical protein HNQ75_003214 [Rhizobium flavum]|uniref:Uncharacterized protein n=1 Tax=Pseudorhizobium flavum TaxID=1335061 RepID=A0A7W9Z0B4_9HYPH|nr:hypothetical protein [Pseudorhizobium flavum]MBB6181229.1 hypothetical protein [Pseudorhizobium flavum]